jgi:teichuronic acid biosynthesis glycosyltransferase TuaG
VLQVNCDTNEICVVIPAFNCAPFIIETLRSVESQALAPGEVCIVDDGSTDQTALLVEEFIAGKQGWILVKKANGGVSSARNAGVAATRARWIAFLDSDDLWRENHLEKLIVYAKDSSADIIVSGVEEFEGDTSNIIATHGLSGQEVSDFPRHIMRWNYIVPSSTLVRREALASLRGFDEMKSMQHAEDWDLWLRAVAAGHGFAFTKVPTLYYRRHQTNASANQAKMYGLGVECLRKNMPSLPQFAPIMKKSLSLCYRRLGNSLAVTDRGKAAEYYRCAVKTCPFSVLCWLAYLLHAAHADAVYRTLARSITRIRVMIRGSQS